MKFLRRQDRDTIFERRFDLIYPPGHDGRTPPTGMRRESLERCANPLYIQGRKFVFSIGGAPGSQGART